MGKIKKPSCKTAQGDCLDLLKSVPDGSVDLICTDPPYGLTACDPKKPGGGSGSSGFMGKKWDAAVPSVAVWRECLRVLKPGGFAFIMSSPRQDCLARMILNLEEAGFVTGYSFISWLYFTGFPKSLNLSKAYGRRAGATREVVGRSNRTIAANPRATNYCGSPTFAETADGREASKYITAPATPEAKRLDGSFAGCALKPALEPVLCVMKPLDQPTYLDQALDNGGGCTHLDDCRIPTNQNLNGGGHSENEGVRWDGDEHWRMKTGGAGPYVQPTGRFPANVICSDDALATGEMTTSCRSTKPHEAYAGESNTGLLRGQSSPDNQYADSGSPSRYFDLDAWWTNRIGCLPEQVQRTFPNLLVPKPSGREKNAGLDEMEKRAKREVYGDGFSTATKVDPKLHTEAGKDARPLHANDHPTTKPVKLMSYLITLGSREHDTVLDPFMGSGTTGVAAIGLGRNFMGCELDPHFIEIAKKRIKWIRHNGLEGLANAPAVKNSKSSNKGDDTAVKPTEKPGKLGKGLWNNRK